MPIKCEDNLMIPLCLFSIIKLEDIYQKFPGLNAKSYDVLEKIFLISRERDNSLNHDEKNKLNELFHNNHFVDSFFNHFEALVKENLFLIKIEQDLHNKTKCSLKQLIKEAKLLQYKKIEYGINFTKDTVVWGDMLNKVLSFYYLKNENLHLLNINIKELKLLIKSNKLTKKSSNNKGVKQQKIFSTVLQEYCLKNNIDLILSSNLSNTHDLLLLGQKGDIKYLLNNNFAHYSQLNTLVKGNLNDMQLLSFTNDLNSILKRTKESIYSQSVEIEEYNKALNAIINTYIQDNKFIKEISMALLNKYEHIWLIMEKSNGNQFKKLGLLNLKKALNKSITFNAFLNKNFFNLTILIDNNIELTFEVGAVGRSNPYKKSYCYEAKLRKLSIANKNYSKDFFLENIYDDFDNHFNDYITLLRN
jgi:hypothetical protein